MVFNYAIVIKKSIYKVDKQMVRIEFNILETYSEKNDIFPNNPHVLMFVYLKTHIPN